MRASAAELEGAAAAGRRLRAAGPGLQLVPNPSMSRAAAPARRSIAASSAAPSARR